MDKEELKQNYASIHTLRMEGDSKLKKQVIETDISIHTLRMEGDRYHPPHQRTSKIFQSTPSAWRVTIQNLVCKLGITVISIHTLRVEGDAVAQKRVECGVTYFNPHPPRGG